MPTHTSHSPAATAAALPPELPPAERPSLSPNGLTTGPCTEYLFNELRKWSRIAMLRPVVYDIPHSKFITISFPDNLCSCSLKEFHNRCIVWRGKACLKLGPTWKSDECSGVPLSMRDEQVVGMSEVHMLSFTATVMPDKGPSGGACVDWE